METQLIGAHALAVHVPPTPSDQRKVNRKRVESKLMLRTLTYDYPPLPFGSSILRLPIWPPRAKRALLAQESSEMTLQTTDEASDVRIACRTKALQSKIRLVNQASQPLR